MLAATTDPQQQDDQTRKNRRLRQDNRRLANADFRFDLKFAIRAKMHHHDAGIPDTPQRHGCRYCDRRDQKGDQQFRQLKQQDRKQSGEMRRSQQCEKALGKTQWDGGGRLHRPVFFQTRRNASVPLVPPNPKLFLRATSIFICRAVLAQ